MNMTNDENTQDLNEDESEGVEDITIDNKNDETIQDLNEEESEIDYENQPEVFPQHEINTQEVLDSIKIDLDNNSDIESPENIEEEIKTDEKKDLDMVESSKKEEKDLDEKPTAQTKNKKQSLEEKTKELYDAFSSFLEIKADIKADIGIKQVIPTGIDLVDAILGGGFGVGAMSIIVGSPGSGKCLFYDEEIEIYVEE